MNLEAPARGAKRTAGVFLKYKAEVDRGITHLNSLFENGGINEEATIKESN